MNPYSISLLMVLFPMRIHCSIERVPALGAIGITETGHKLVLALQS